MLLNKIPLYLAICVCLLTAYALFNIKENVMTLKFELKEVKKQVQHEQDTIHVLKAELAYLSSPSRLHGLAAQYLKLESTKVGQMIIDPLKNKENNILNHSTSGIRLARAVKWRYKKGPVKYITTVSDKR